MKVGKVAAAVVAAAIGGGLLFASPAHAHYDGAGQLYAQMEVYPYSYNSTWQSAIDRGLSYWNATPTPAYISKYQYSGSSVTAASYSDTWYGLYQRCGDNCYYIKLNARTISRDAYNFQNFATSTTVHEYGHALNLAHNSVFSIMNHSRDRNTVYTPQPHDIDDVNAYY
ncbi:hypothetical protein [Dactylosporangium sp. CA-139066]|uniref:hypothetical protein n=1 Tax=Dactylosporangium sp. CA-139066 TaxID=3239930 RepID=UPI003D93B261